MKPVIDHIQITVKGFGRGGTIPFDQMSETEKSCAQGTGLQLNRKKKN